MPACGIHGTSTANCIIAPRARSKLATSHTVSPRSTAANAAAVHFASAGRDFGQQRRRPRRPAAAGRR